MRRLSIILLLLLTFVSAQAQDFALEAFLEKARLATARYQEGFKNLVAEEHKTYEYFRRDGTVEDSRRIKSVFLVYQSPTTNYPNEFRTVIEFQGKNVARKDEDLAKLFARLTRAASYQEEVAQLRKEADRFDGRSHAWGVTLGQGLVLQKNYRSFFAFQIVGREKIAGCEVLVVDYQQVKPTPLIKVRATDEERKQEPNGIAFDTSLPDKFRPTNPRVQGKIWLDAETAQIWRDEFTVTIQPNGFLKPVTSGEFRYEYQSSQFAILVPKRFWMSSYRFSGNNEKDLAVTRDTRKIFEYSKFSNPDADVKDYKISPSP